MSAVSTRWGWLLGIAFAFSGNCALAQITPDGTLPNNSNVTLQGNTFNITGGTQAGSNLFHSFGQFSVPTGGTAFFNNAVDIQNIISRVTGGSISNIDGLIRANGTANLFLINPSGIVFGQNASLNVGGSFVASTADAIQFGNLGFFSATNPNSPALLTINPSALFFNQIATASIQNNSVAPAGLDPAGFDLFGLRVPDGKSLLLVGGNVSMDGGQLNANSGRVELGGLGEPGTVALGVDGDNLSLIFPDNVKRGSVSFTNQAAIYVTGAGGGNIAVNARNLEILGGTVLSAGIGQGLGTPETVAGDITLNATGEIKVAGGSIVRNLVRLGSQGNGGNIIIDSGSFSLQDGTQISTSTFGQGNAGNVTVRAKEAVDLANSDIISTVESGGVGKGGNIDINAATLSLKDGAQLQTLVRQASDTRPAGRGDAGNVNIDVRDAVTIGGVNNGPVSGVYTYLDNGAIGNAGDINIKAGSLSLSDGARLNASIYGQGNAGSVFVQVSEELSLANSNILSAVQNEAVGNGGDINIKAGTLSLSDGASLIASTLGRGNAGNVFVQASDSVSLINSTIASSVQNEAVGNGGDINITAGALSLSDGAALFASTFGKGNAGNVFVQASGRVSLANNSFISSNVAKEVVGSNGGDINITAGSLSLTNGASLFASTSGKGNGGSIFVQASDSVSLANSNILSSVDSGAVGNSGDITIKAKTFSLTDGASLLTAILGQGNAGSVFVQASGRVSLASGSSISSNVVGVGSGGDINITAGSLSLTGASLFTATLGRGDAGNVTIKADGAVSFDGSRVIDDGLPRLSGAYSGVIATTIPGSVGIGNGGDINITAGSFSLTNGALLSTFTGGQGDAGNVTIKANGTVSLDGAGGVTIGNIYVPSSIHTGVGAVPAGETFRFLGVIPEQGIVGNGKGGDINITAGSLSLTNGAQLSTSTGGQGDAGNVTIKADGTVSLDGAGETIGGFSVPSGVSTGVGAISASDTFRFFGAISEQGIVGNGKGGDINITAGSLSLTNSARLETSTAGQGNAGSVFVQAKDSVSLAGSGTGIFSAVGSGAVGKGGDIDIQSRTLSMTGGAELAASTSGQGNAGNILVNATDEVELSGVAPFPVLEDGRPGGFSSGLFTTTGKGASGQGGELRVTTDTLRISDGAVLSARSQSSSKGGNITVNANVLEVINGGQLLTTAFNSGDAGNITVKVKDRITISGSDPTFSDRFNSVAKVFGEEQAKVTIDPVRPASGLFANTATGSSGNGGNIFIQPRTASAPKKVTIQDGAKIAVDSQGTGVGGNIEIQAGNLTLNNQGLISAETVSSQGGNITLDLQDILLLRRNSQISTNAGTAQAGGDGGNITINTPNGFVVAVPQENSDITANAFTGSGGRVDITASGIYGIESRPRRTFLSDITASSERGVQGTVDINTPDVDPNRGLLQLPTGLVNTPGLVSSSCNAFGKGGSEFTVTGRGGLPPSPDDFLSGDVVWTDNRLSNTTRQQHRAEKPTTKPAKPKTLEIIPATGWVINDKGEVTLISSAPSASSSVSPPTCVQQ